MEKRERFEFNAGQRPGAVSSVSARRGERREPYSGI